MEKEKTNFFDSKFMKGLQHAGEKLAAYLIDNRLA